MFEEGNVDGERVEVGFKGTYDSLEERMGFGRGVDTLGFSELVGLEREVLGQETLDPKTLSS